MTYATIGLDYMLCTLENTSSVRSCSIHWLDLVVVTQSPNKVQGHTQIQNDCSDTPKAANAFAAPDVEIKSA